MAKQLILPARSYRENTDTFCSSFLQEKYRSTEMIGELLDWDDPIVNTRWPQFEPVDHAPACSWIEQNWYQGKLAFWSILRIKDHFRKKQHKNTNLNSRDFSQPPEKAWIKAKSRNRRVKLTEQVYDPTCLFTFTTVHIAGLLNNIPFIHLTLSIIYILLEVKNFV